MKAIQKFVERIEEEIEDAAYYAEKAVECKAAGNMRDAEKYREMASDELKHGTMLHEMATVAITQLNKVFKPTTEMQEKWDHSHKIFVERVAWIKQMLAM